MYNSFETHPRSFSVEQAPGDTRPETLGWMCVMLLLSTFGALMISCALCPQECLDIYLYANAE